MELEIIKYFKANADNELIAVIKFSEGVKPMHNDSVIIEGIQYRIVGIISASTPNDLERIKNNIYDCWLRKIE